MVDGQQRIVLDTAAAGFSHATVGLSSHRREAAFRVPRRTAEFSKAIEADIIPRLVMAHGRLSRSPDCARAASQLEADRAVDGFADLLLSDDPDEATAHVFDLYARGTSTEALFIALLAPAARNLGDRWLEDRCSFADVTLGMWRLQQLLRDLTPAFQKAAGRTQPDRAILLVNLPGEQHTFGLMMLAEFFRRARWNVTCSNPLIHHRDATKLVRVEWFNVVGLSLSSVRRIEEVAKLVRAIRRNSLNPAVGIMVGGPVFLDHPELVARVGADVTAVDGRTAPLQADLLAGRDAGLLC